MNVIAICCLETQNSTWILSSMSGLFIHNVTQMIKKCTAHYRIPNFLTCSWRGHTRPRPHSICLLFVPHKHFSFSRGGFLSGVWTQIRRYFLFPYVLPSPSISRVLICSSSKHAKRNALWFFFIFYFCLLLRNAI